jgi:hypothetical protein
MVVKKVTVRCYVTLPPFAAEPVLQPGQSWWQALLPIRTRESNLNKRSCPSPEDEIPDEPVSMSLPEPVKSHAELGFRLPDFLLDPWDDKQTFKLLLPVENEDPKDAIAQCIDILMDAKI